MWNKLGWFWQFLCDRLSSFNPKRFYYSYAWPYGLCEGRTAFCTRHISRKLYGFLFMFSTGFTTLSVLLLFPLSITFFAFIYSFDSITSNIDEILSINPSADVFIFGDFNVHYKDWLTYSGGTNTPGELCYLFSNSNDLAQMVNFPTRISDCDSHIYFYLLTLVFVLQWLSLHW